MRECGSLLWVPAPLCPLVASFLARLCEQILQITSRRRHYSLTAARHRDCCCVQPGRAGRGVPDPALEARHEETPPRACTRDGAVHPPSMSRRLRTATNGRRWCWGLSLSAPSAPNYLANDPVLQSQSKQTEEVRRTRNHETTSNHHSLRDGAGGRVGRGGLGRHAGQLHPDER